MLYRKNLSTALIVSALLFLVTSCAGLQLDPPSPDKQTLLVLPVKLTNNTMTSKQAFYYIYTIANAGNRSDTLDAVIKLPLKGDMLIVDSLPPGDYIVSQFSYFPVGSGVSFSGNNVAQRNDRFTLESGKITIFSQTLHVTMTNETVGRMGTTYFGFNMEATSVQQKQEVTQTLKALPNIEAWEFSKF